MRATTLYVQSAKKQSGGQRVLSKQIRTSNDLSRAKRIANVDIGLRYLAEHQQDLNYLPLHVCRRIAAARHYVKKRRRQRIEQALSDEQPTKVILRGSRTLQLENGPNSVQRVYDELALLCEIFIKEIN
jgi:hypothetical protein